MAPAVQKVFFFAGGGTGGHLYPGLAVAERLQQMVPGCQIHFIGTAKGLETRVVPGYGYPLHLISVRGVSRNRFWINLLVPFRLLASLWQCRRLVRAYHPVAVLGTGSYVSGPMIYAAHGLGIPTLIQEQNSYPGVTTRLLARFADEVHLSFEESQKYFSPSSRLYLSGTPVRSLSVKETPADARRHFGLDPAKETLLVFGGSQGSQIINRTLASVVRPLLEQTAVQILWVSGTHLFKEVQLVADGLGERVQVVEYLLEMPLAYRAATLAICRSGALTLAELALCGLPAILIPFAAAAANHQQSNAQALSEQAAAKVILEKELNPDLLLQTIVSLLQDPQSRERMSRALSAIARPDAAERLARAMLLLGERKGA